MISPRPCIDSRDKIDLSFSPWLYSNKLRASTVATISKPRLLIRSYGKLRMCLLESDEDDDSEDEFKFLRGKGKEIYFR